MASSSVSVFPSLFFLHLVLLFSSEYGNRTHETCPSSFDCGELGTFHFPFTNPELEDCGFITVNGCDDPSSKKSIELEKNNGTMLRLLKGIEKNIITALDEDLDKLLKSKSYCHVFDTNLSSLLPNSALVSFQILNNRTFIKCGHCHNVSRPTGFFKHVCTDFDVYWEGSSRRKRKNNTHMPISSFPNCSVLELPSTDMSNTDDFLSFLTSQIDIQVRLSHDCDKCYNHLGGLCLLDANNQFYCKFAENTGKDYKLEFGVGIRAAIVGVFVLIIFWFRRTLFHDKMTIFWKNKSKAHQDLEAFLKSQRSLATKRYSYSEIKKMTNCFKEKLGQGGYGSVFKGKLHDKCSVAVKVLNETKGTGEEFINEVASVSKTSHINIVTLLGFCFEGSKRALVYEFMANGSLEKFIFENEAGLLDDNFQLGCDILHQIVVGVAQGLEYLHKGCNIRIFHFDIKLHNILLDENICPKVSDFGLAKMCPRNESVVSILGARGSIGYITPKIIYRNFGAVSHKSGVYSFRMMVLEMVGGRRYVNVNVDDTSEIYFPHWIYKRLELNEDLALQSIRNEADKESIRQMVITSLWCIQTNPSDRPMMTKVAEMLEGRVETLQVAPKAYLSSPSRSPCPSSSSTL